jgi:hypothetical protein
MKKIIFIGGARDYHVVDWYRTIKEICSNSEIVFVTDSIDGEGFEKLINEDDCIIKLLNIDWLLFTRQSKYGNIWRNFIKLIFIPLQVLRLKEIARDNPDAIFHAMPMYYMFLCRLASIPYIGTPQGSEILVRPDRSRLYKYFATKSLLAAQNITVDSVNMQNMITQLCGKESTVIQNGIDVSAISRIAIKSHRRENVVSIRGFTTLYRINEIFDGRDHSLQKPRLHLLYPFREDVYRATVAKRFEPGDCDLGRLSRQKMFELLASTFLAISIPISDSSPRSVYEAIFCGCCVAVTYNPWVDALPECMKSRLFIIDLKDNLWFEKAIEQAKHITTKDYNPSEEALELFDKRRSMQKMVDLFYKTERP